MRKPVVLRKRWRALLGLVALCLISTRVGAQTFTPVDLTAYPFIDESLNTISNDTAGLKRFYVKLKELQEGKIKKVTIVQVGDSHIEADMFSGVVRVLMQQNFGNAGRGLIFPYRCARTTEPRSIYTSTNVEWEVKRNCFPKLPLPIGISGITIKTYDSAAYIHASVYDGDNLNYGFNKITLFHNKGKDAYDFAILNENQAKLGYINSQNTRNDIFSTTITLRDTLHNIFIKTVKKDTAQQFAMIYGLLLENDQPGILYNMIGVNGAMYSHYDSSVYFAQQLAELQPDLIIISLGTNDAYTKDFNDQQFYGDMDKLVKNLQGLMPGADFILTTPPDGYRLHKYKNPSVASEVNVMKKYCLSNNLGFWDFYHLMGGFGSIYKWNRKGLAQHDMIHLTKPGYEIQGKLFYNALIAGYQKYEQ